MTATLFPSEKIRNVAVVGHSSTLPPYQPRAFVAAGGRQGPSSRLPLRAAGYRNVTRILILARPLVTPCNALPSTAPGEGAS